jgi:hypothetical protein
MLAGFTAGSEFHATLKNSLIMFVFIPTPVYMECVRIARPYREFDNLEHQ